MPGLVSVKTPANAPQLHESPEVSSAAVLNVDNPSLESLDFGPFLIKLARDAIASSEGPNEALDYAIRATKSFEKCFLLPFPAEVIVNIFSISP
ncbi:hypothetical protein YC2023_018300 [Brassica napus]